MIAAQRAQMSRVAGAGQEALILTTVRKQVDALEEKLFHQIERKTEQVDKAREAVSSRIDHKLTSLETRQQTAERSIAKHVGSIDVFKEELKQHEGRFSSGDSRMAEWRRQIEEEFQVKLKQLETSFAEKVDRSIKVMKSSHDEIIKGHNQRILKLQTQMEQVVDDREDKSQRIGLLDVGLQRLEEAEFERTRNNAIMSAGDGMRSVDAATGGSQDQNAVAGMELWVSETMHQSVQQLKDQMQADNNELQTVVHTLQERYSSLQKRQQELVDQQSRTLDDRIQKESWDRKLKDLQDQLKDKETSWGQLSEKTQIMHDHINHHAGVHNELKQSMRRLQERQERSSESLALMAGSDLDPSSPMSPFALGASLGGVGGAGLEDLLVGQVKDLDERISALAEELRGHRADSKIGPQVAALITTLREISPKVLNHDKSLMDLQEKVEHKASQSALQEEVQPKIQELCLKLDELSNSSNQGVNMLSGKQKTMEKTMEKQFVTFDDRLGRLEAIGQMIPTIRRELTVLQEETYGPAGERFGAGIPEHEEEVEDEDQVDLETLQSQRKAPATE